MDNDGLVACVRAAQAGSLHDFEVLVQQFQDMAMGYSRVLLNDTHLAEDAAQDAFVQAYTRLEQLQTPEAFPGWFWQIVYSCCMRYRQRRKQKAMPLDIIGHVTIGHVVDPQPLPTRCWPIKNGPCYWITRLPR
jgi:DNA-directed RNA polymerase specialized sigma24 family protein